MKNSILKKIQRCLLKELEIEGREKRVLIDKQSLQKVTLKFKGDYLLYNFEKTHNIFPYFNDIKGLKAICDYIFFTIRNHKLFGIAIELKKTRITNDIQLEMSKNFITFVLERINKSTPLNIKTEVKGIAVVEHPIVKGVTKPSSNFKQMFNNNNILWNGQSLPIFIFTN